MRFVYFLALSLWFTAHAGAIDDNKIPKALIIEHTGDTYDGAYTAPDGTVAPAKERHKDGYSGTYIYEGEFNGLPYWVKNGCRGEFVINECRCYIYFYKKGLTWVLVPQPPGTSGALYGSSDDWLANAYNDSRWPWLGTWNGNIKGVNIDNDIDLDQARIDAKINACPANENNKASLEDEAEDKETNTPPPENNDLTPKSSLPNIENKVDDNSDLNATNRIGEELDTDNEYNKSNEDRRIIAPDSKVNIIREEKLAKKDQKSNTQSLKEIKVQNGGVYKGDFKDGQPHGLGMVHFAARGIIYFGEWKFGAPDGEGIKYEKETEDFYLGEFVNGQKNNKGTSYFVKSPLIDIAERFLTINPTSKEEMKFLLESLKNTVSSLTRLTKYSGTYKDNLMHGRGTLKFEDQSLYSGFFVSGLPNGQGKKNFTNGDYYKGNFKDGNPSGKGILKSADGSEYSGEFKHGLANGKGRKRFPDRTVYSGQFIDGVANGRGTFTDKFRNQYTGLWKDGKLIKEDKVKVKR